MKYNIINIIDIESTCWNKSEKGNISEIIEIGISEYNNSLEGISSVDHIFVTPTLSKVSKFCTDLTGITQEQVDSKGISFHKACKILRNTYDSKNRIWASYGNYDRNMFEEQCFRENVGYPFGGKHINVKPLFALKYKLQKEVGMDEALKILGISLEGRHHSGKDDSYNIAKILREILK